MTLTQEMKDSFTQGFDDLLLEMKRKQVSDYMDTHLKRFYLLISDEEYEVVRKELQTKQLVLIKAMLEADRIDVAALDKLCEQTNALLDEQVALGTIAYPRLGQLKPEGIAVMARNSGVAMAEAITKETTV